VKVVVDQARQRAAALEIDDLRVRSGMGHHLRLPADREELAVLDRDRAGGRLASVERGETAVAEDEIGGHRWSSARLGLALGQG